MTGLRVALALVLLVVAFLVLIGVAAVRFHLERQAADEDPCGARLVPDASGPLAAAVCVRERGHAGDHCWTDGNGQGAVWGPNGAGRLIRRVGR